MTLVMLGVTYFWRSCMKSKSRGPPRKNQKYRGTTLRWPSSNVKASAPNAAILMGFGVIRTVNDPELVPPTHSRSSLNRPVPVQVTFSLSVKDPLIIN